MYHFVSIGRHDSERKTHFLENTVDTVQGTNISHLGKSKNIFKSSLVGDMLIPWRVENFGHANTGIPNDFFDVSMSSRPMDPTSD